MSIQVSFGISKIKVKEFEVRQEIAKNRKLTCNWNLPKWKLLLLKITSSYKLQMNFCPTWKLKILFSHFQKVQEHSIPMYGWQVMIKSFSKNFELQSGISFKPFGQIEWGFLLQVIFDVLYPNLSSQFTKNQPTKMAFFKCIELKREGWKNWLSN